MHTKNSTGFQTKPLYKKVRGPRMPLFVLLFLVIVTPLQAQTKEESYTKTFIITAYYSPLPGQCCYVKGGLAADRILNGEGHTAADGTAVYPGMLAAPPNYAFGTRIDLPGIGALTVHDRGGAIQVLPNADRLDIWVGHGEEGLARALAFGVQEFVGTVYPAGSHQPPRNFSLDRLEAPLSRLEKYLIEGTSLVAMNPKLDERGLSVMIMQDTMRTAGYFDAKSHGHFSIGTKKWLDQFVTDFGLHESTDKLTAKTAAHLLAAAARSAAVDPVSMFVDAKASESAIAGAQRTLRFLGYYRGRTNGEYSDQLASAILTFQQDNYLVGTQDDPGAGRIGPITMRSLKAKWNKKLVAKRARSLLLMQNIENRIEKNGRSIAQFLSENDSGKQVSILQKLLADRGFFPENKINGNFGPMTKEAVVQYQIANGIIESPHSKGAGNVGPGTLALLRQEEKKDLYRLVLSEGMQVL
ncbi:MAG: peptidoglycan-binding protein [bacterium]|nr:peptidoglycan-binding protein [bacterium]